MWMRAGCAALGWVAFMAVGAHAEVAYPSGTQDFESMAVGDSVDSLGWIIVNGSAPPTNFQIRAADDVLGVTGPRDGSTRWLRAVDTDGGPVQNRFYSPTIQTPQVLSYVWTYYVNLEATPPGGADTKPKIVVQHLNGAFANAWGIEFTDTGANLIVTGIGGPAASTPLYPLAAPTGVGDWVKIQLAVDFDSNQVLASANGGPLASLPISLTGDKTTFRFCYRGEGPGNVATMLIDDVSLRVQEPVPATTGWGMAVLASLLVLGLVLQQGRRSMSRAEL